MTTQIPPEIQKALDHMQAGNAELARPILSGYLRERPDSEQAWYLLSLAVFDSGQRLDCLRQVLRINPNHAKAKQRIASLQAAQQANEKESLENTNTPNETMPSTSQALSTAPSPASLNKKKERTIRKKKPSVILLILIGLFTLILLISCIVASYFAYTYLLNPALLAAEVPLAQSTQAVMFSSARTPLESSYNSPTPYQLPATWTATTSPSITPTPTITASPVPSATPTFILPAPVVQEQMDEIQVQVSELRGLPWTNEVNRFLVLPGNVEEMLRTELSVKGKLSELEDKGRVLSILGLIEPDYDLVNFTMNHLVDNIGGFYRPVERDIFVIGTRFGGIQRFVYSHEFDHALTDQVFDFERMGIENCEKNNDRCDALRALIEGDATLAMGIWLKEYANQDDYLDIIRYIPPALALPAESPPDYAIQSVNFPYTYGLNFVEALFKQGEWEVVNQAYQQPPETSEQILHPEKFFAGETALPLIDIPLESILSPSWEKITEDVLGEWTTFLILAYGANVEARQEEDVALRAAEGWGNDHYQVFYSKESNQVLLSAHWRWDRETDAGEFLQAMQDTLEKRYQGVRFEYQSGVCWQAISEFSCLLNTQDETLWVIVPEVELLDTILAVYPNFKQNK